MFGSMIGAATTQTNPYLTFDPLFGPTGNCGSYFGGFGTLPHGQHSTPCDYAFGVPGANWNRYNHAFGPAVSSTYAWPYFGLAQHQQMPGFAGYNTGAFPPGLPRTGGMINPRRSAPWFQSPFGAWCDVGGQCFTPNPADQQQIHTGWPSFSGAWSTGSGLPNTSFGFGQVGATPEVIPQYGAFTGQQGVDRFGSPERFAGRLPCINLWEDDATLCVEAEVPGVSLDDIDLQIAGRSLVIQTGRLIGGGQNDKRRRLIYGERMPAGYSRVIHLPTEIDGEKVEAKLHNGVLRLMLPKLNAQQRRTIRVNQVAAA